MKYERERFWYSMQRSACLQLATCEPVLMRRCCRVDLLAEFCGNCAEFCEESACVNFECGSVLSFYISLGDFRHMGESYCDLSACFCAE